MKICFFHLMPYRVPARGLRAQVPFGLGRSAAFAVRSREVRRALSGVPRRAGVRREVRLRRPLRHGTIQRLRSHALRPHAATLHAADPSRAALTRGSATAGRLNPPLRVAEEFAMLDSHEPRPPGGGVSGSARRWTELAYGIDPGRCASGTTRSRPRRQAWTRPGCSRSTASTRRRS